jgi:hypothetical protein
MVTYPLVIWTIRSYVETGHTAHVRCPVKGCGWHPAPDLPALVRAGFGEKAVRDLKLECPTHRVLLGLTIVPPSKFATDF